MTTKYDYIAALSPAEVREAGSTPEAAAEALIAWEREHGSMFSEPDEQERGELVDEVRRFAFPPVTVGTYGQGILAGNVGDTEIRVLNKNRCWMAGLYGTSPTVDVTNIIHDTAKLHNALRKLVEDSRK